MRHPIGVTNVPPNFSGNHNFPPVKIKFEVFSRPPSVSFITNFAFSVTPSLRDLCKTTVMNQVEPYVLGCVKHSKTLDRRKSSLCENSRAPKTSSRLVVILERLFVASVPASVHRTEGSMLMLKRVLFLLRSIWDFGSVRGPNST